MAVPPASPGPVHAPARRARAPSAAIEGLPSSSSACWEAPKCFRGTQYKRSAWGRGKKGGGESLYANKFARPLWRLARAFVLPANHFKNKGGPVEIAHAHWVGGCNAKEEFKPRVSGIIFPRRAVRVPEVT